jgi:hypothetical protein
MERQSPIKFAKEFQNDPSTELTSQFSSKDFRTWSILEGDYMLHDRDGSIIERGALKECTCAIGCDLAWEEGRRHDSTALVPVLKTPTGLFLIDNYCNQKGIKPDRLADILFTLNDKYSGLVKKVIRFGFEKGKYEKVAKWYLKQEYKKRSKALVIKDMPWVTDKIERIVTPLQPFYANNMIYHRKGMGDLETQLIRFPSGVNDDLPDALQMAVRLLSETPNKIEIKEKSEDDKFKDFVKLFKQETPNRLASTNRTSIFKNKVGFYAKKK